MRRFCWLGVVVVLVWSLHGIALAQDKLTGDDEHLKMLLTEAQSGALIPAEPARTLNWVEKMLSETEYDFGVVARGAKVEHVITITNRYKEEVTFWAPTATCGPCVTTTLDRKRLKPKETAQLKVNLDTLRFGDIRRQQIILTASFDNGAHTSTGLIPVAAFIRTDLSVAEAPSDDSRPGHRLLQVAGPRPDWVIQGVYSASPEIPVQWKSITGDGTSVSRYEVLLPLEGDKPAATNKQIIVIKTNDSKRNAVIIDCR